MKPFIQYQVSFLGNFTLWMLVSKDPKPLNSGLTQVMFAKQGLYSGYFIELPMGLHHQMFKLK